MLAEHNEELMKIKRAGPWSMLSYSKISQKIMIIHTSCIVVYGFIVRVSAVESIHTDYDK